MADSVSSNGKLPSFTTCAAALHRLSFRSSKRLLTHSARLGRRSSHSVRLYSNLPPRAAHSLRVAYGTIVLPLLGVFLANGDRLFDGIRQVLADPVVAFLTGRAGRVVAFQHGGKLGFRGTRSDERRVGKQCVSTC